jgi:hypothetical protein
MGVRKTTPLYTGKPIKLKCILTLTSLPVYIQEKFCVGERKISPVYKGNIWCGVRKILQISWSGLALHI